MSAYIEERKTRDLAVCSLRQRFRLHFHFFCIHKECLCVTMMCLYRRRRWRQCHCVVLFHKRVGKTRTENNVCGHGRNFLLILATEKHTNKEHMKLSYINNLLPFQSLRLHSLIVTVQQGLSTLSGVVGRQQHVWWCPMSILEVVVPVGQKMMKKQQLMLGDWFL